MSTNSKALMLFSFGLLLAATTPGQAQGLANGAPMPAAYTPIAPATPADPAVNPVATATYNINPPPRIPASSALMTARPATPPVTARNPALALAPSAHPTAAAMSPVAATPPTARIPVPPTGYWGAAPPPVPPKKPNAVQRLFNRIGNFMGADEEMGANTSYRDITTGRTNTINSKPWISQNK